MMTSPGSMQLGELVDDLCPVIAAGTITHAARGFSSFATKSSSDGGAGRALALERRHRVGADVVDDALVPVAHQAAHDVRAHPAEADHAKLRHRLLLRYSLRSRDLAVAADQRVGRAVVRRAPARSSLSSSGTIRCASTLPSSTPHWSNELMPQIAPCVKTLCS